MTVAFKPAQVSISVAPPNIGISTGIAVIRGNAESSSYKGEYSVTPTNETQILETKNLQMTDNVVVNAIPQNYGLITWNGSTLTVS